ncbi:MAG: hypothetical protein GXP63_07325 [DPANN group archaeon]|nr:hypothetical protein [DPANN group archaeon]
MDLKEKLLSLAIAIIFVFFIVYGYNTFIPEPQRDAFCKDISYQVAVDDCPGWQADRKGPLPRPQAEGECWCNQDCSSGTCQKTDCFAQNPAYAACEQEYDHASEARNRMIFIASLIIGVIVIVAGGMFLKAEPVSIGMMGGGILTIIYGTLRYWGRLEDVGRFLILGIVLGILIWVGYRKFSAAPRKK